MITLTRDELIEVSGYKQPSKIAKWFRERGYPLNVGADGWPRVIRDHYLNGGKVTSNALTRSVPNIAALIERQKNGKKTNHTTRPA